jgi:hypothetical protein
MQSIYKDLKLSECWAVFYLHDSNLQWIVKKRMYKNWSMVFWIQQVLKKYSCVFMNNERYVPMSKQTSLRKNDFPTEFLIVYF